VANCLNSVSCVLVDNGEPVLERSLRSLRDQTVPVEIIVCPGPKTDLRVAEKYADKVLEPVEAIGRARVAGILAARGRYIVCADSDTVYEKHYAEYAAQTLGSVNAVRAGVILPLEVAEPLSVLEPVFHFLFPVGPCEFAIAFRRQAFLEADIHQENYDHPLRDVGASVWGKLGLWPDWRMTCWTRLPTRFGRQVAEQYAPSTLAGAIPILGVVGTIIASELTKGKGR